MGFIKEMLSTSSETSSKRVNGTLCVASMVLIVVLSIIFDWDISSVQENLLSTIF
jgi:hypothetical protein